MPYKVDGAWWVTLVARCSYATGETVGEMAVAPGAVYPDKARKIHVLKLEVTVTIAPTVTRCSLLSH